MVQSIMPSVVGQFVLGPNPNSASSIGNGPSAGNLPRHLTNEECGIREVWAHNLEEEFYNIRRLVHQFPFVAMVGELLRFILSKLSIAQFYA